MLVLYFKKGETFATGAMQYKYEPVTPNGTDFRVHLRVEVDEVPTPAFVDTGGMYLLCPPGLARQLDLNPEDGWQVEHAILFRGSRLQGTGHRVSLTLIADEGEDVKVEVTAFVPDTSPEQEWESEFPCILGLYLCLDLLRFAIDPAAEKFYFGFLA